MDSYYINDKYCSKNDAGEEHWLSMAKWVTFNINFRPLTKYDYYYYYSNYDDWLQTASIEVHLTCSDGSRLKGIEPTSTTPAPTTMSPTTMNSFYVNGLDQEYLIDRFQRTFQI